MQMRKGVIKVNNQNNIRKIVEKYSGFSPFQIAEQKGMEIRRKELPPQVDGFMTSALGHSYTVLNKNLSKNTEKIVICRFLSRNIIYGSQHKHIQISGDVNKNTEIELCAAAIHALQANDKQSIERSFNHFKIPVEKAVKLYQLNQNSILV